MRDSHPQHIEMVIKLDFVFGAAMLEFLFKASFGCVALVVELGLKYGLAMEFGLCVEIELMGLFCAVVMGLGVLWGWGF